MISKITLACVVTLTALITQRREETMNKLTPVILVEEIEPCLDFWTSLGFERTAEVPGDGTLSFVSLQLGNVEIMYQSRASVLEDMPALAQGSLERSGIAFFIEVDDLEPLKPALAAAETVVPERETFYGMREIGVRSPCGTIVTFAQRLTN